MYCSLLVCLSMGAQTVEGPVCMTLLGNLCCSDANSVGNWVVKSWMMLGRGGLSLMVKARGEGGLLRLGMVSMDPNLVLVSLELLRE